MKSKNIILTVLLTALPSVMMAQQHIRQAFDALLDEGNIEIKTQHVLERNQETGRKEAQSDVYDLMVVSPSGKCCVSDILEAFDKDKENAYTVQSDDHSGTNYISLAVGDGLSRSVPIGNIKGSKYIYACFLDQDDPEGKYRYAYAMEWVDRKDKVQVRLAVTYATTQKYRQNKRPVKTITINGNEYKLDSPGHAFANGFWMDGNNVLGPDSLFFAKEKSAESWLSEFNTYKNLFQENTGSPAANHYATSIYKLCKNAKSLDDEEKDLVANEILKLRKKTDDDFIQRLFDMSIERLRK